MLVTLSACLRKHKSQPKKVYIVYEVVRTRCVRAIEVSHIRSLQT